MTIKVTSVSIRDVKSLNRFEPKLYLFQATMKKARQSFNFTNIENISTKVCRGQSPKPTTYKDKDTANYIFIKTADVKKYTLNSETAVFLDNQTFETQKVNRVKGGDILISVVGNYLGSTCVIPQNIKNGAFNDNSARIRITDKKISPYYVSAFFNSYFGQSLIQSLVTRTGQKIISAGNVKKLEIPIINNPEIDSLYTKSEESETTANNLIAKARTKLYECIGIDFSKIKKQNFFSSQKKFFTSADLWGVKYSYPLYINTLQKIRNKWPTTTISQIASCISGDEVGSDSYINYTDKKTTDIPFIRTSDIVNYGTDQFPDFYVPVEVFNELKQNLRPRDILFTKDGKIGMVGMVTEGDKAIVSSGFAILRVNEHGLKLGITPEYLFTVLSIKEIGSYEAKRRTVIASTIPHLREDRLGEIEIPILKDDRIKEISKLIKEAFSLKSKKKQLDLRIQDIINSYF